MRHVLKNPEFAFGILAWSWDDKFLLTAAEQQIKMWNVQVSVPAFSLPPDCVIHRLCRRQGS